MSLCATWARVGESVRREAEESRRREVAGERGLLPAAEATSLYPSIPPHLVNPTARYLGDRLNRLPLLVILQFWINL